jgi:hypothetical protein
MINKWKLFLENILQFIISKLFNILYFKVKNQFNFSCAKLRRRSSHYQPGEGKVHPITGQQGPRGGVEVYLYSFSTSALEEDWWSAPRPGRFTPIKTRYPLYRRLGGLQGRSGRVRKISPPPGFDPRTVQPVVSHYTDWATRTTQPGEGTTI